MATRLPPAALPAHPHVAALQGVCSLVLFLGATPVVLWLVSTVIMPALGMLGSPERWRGHLEQVAASEAAQADLASPRSLLPGLRLQPGWPHAWAVWQVARLLPPDDAASAAATPATAPAPARAELPLVRALGAAWRARFRGWWPLQRTYLVLAVTRLVYALQVAGLAAPGALYCYRLGERQALLGRARGQPPSPMRSRFWYGLCRQLTAGIPGCCFLPLGLPTVPLLALLTALALGSLLQARRHAIAV